MTIYTGDWIYFLSAYLQEAISGFLGNYRKKHMARGGKEPRKLNEMIDSDAPIDQDGAKEETMLDKLIASPNSEGRTMGKELSIQIINALNERQAKIAILLGEGNNYEDVAEEIGCSTKTVQREWQAILKNKKIHKLLTV